LQTTLLRYEGKVPVRIVKKFRTINGEVDKVRVVDVDLREVELEVGKVALVSKLRLLSRLVTVRGLVELIPCRRCGGKAILIGRVEFRNGREELYFKCTKCGRRIKFVPRKRRR